MNARSAIVCATDLSEGSEGAVAVAAALARRFGDRLVLAHVVNVATLAPDAPWDVGAFTMALKEAADAAIKQRSAALGSEGLEVVPLVEFGFPGRVLVDAARTHRARLVVAGSHGRKGLGRALLGSVAEELVHDAPCPVLIVRDGHSRLIEWAASKRRLRVVVGLDNSAASEEAIGWVRSLRETVACDLTFLHVYWPPAEHERVGIREPWRSFETDPEVLRVLDRELRGRIGTLPGEGAVDLKLLADWGYLKEPLTRETETSGPDLLVVGTHQRRGLARFGRGSTAVAFLREASVPVLCVPLQRPAHLADAPIGGIKSVLCAVDLTDLGVRIVPAAYALLRAGGGDVELCHVLDRAAKAEERAALERRLRELVPHEAEALGIETRVSLLEGTPSDAISQAATRLGCDAVVVGSHVRSVPGKAILGSVSEAVVKTSPVPVTIVRTVAG